MKVWHRKAADYQRQAWRNGGGWTTELEKEGAGKFLWRLSIAEVERSGPFSDFAGYERTLVLLEGDGMELTFDTAAVAVVDQPHRPLVFDGGARVDCRLLGGPVKDMNLMVDRDRARGTLAVRALEAPAQLRAESRWLLLYALDGTSEARVSGVEYRLAPGELLRIDDAQGCMAALRPAEKTAVLVEIAVREIVP